MGKTHAYGTTFSWDGELVGKLTAINGIEITVDQVDASTHDSPDAFKEMLPGMLDAGEVSLEGFFDNEDTTGQLAILADMYARAKKAGIITFPAAAGTTWTFMGYVVGCKIGDATTDGAIPFSAKIKVTGKPVLAVAASTGLTAPIFTISESAVITPTPAGDIYSYVATVLAGVTSVKVTPTATAGVITVNGNVVATGEESSAITLGDAGTNTTITVVVTETGKSPKTYTIIVARAA